MTFVLMSLKENAFLTLALTMPMFFMNPQGQVFIIRVKVTQSFAESGNLPKQRTEGRNLNLFFQERKKGF